MEDHAENPACQPKVPEQKIVGSESVPGRYRLPYLGQPLLVCQEVEQREEDRERLLDSHEAIERPLAMVLNDWIEHRRITERPVGRDHMLARVVALRGAKSIARDGDGELEVRGISILTVCRLA